ncbi:MAG: dihydroorotase [Oleiphilus sp.]|nr:MAG: dihydroorotase [Oleiphilus sp.]
MKPASLVIRNGQYLNKDLNWIPFESIRVEHGMIAAIDGKDEPSSDQLIIDAKGGHVIPGLVDLNASLREPGDSRSGTIESETRAAAAGGVTHLCCTPDTQPINDSKAVTKLIKEISEVSAHCQVLPLGAMTKQLEGRQISSYAALGEAGCIGLSNGTTALNDLLTMQRCFEYANTQDIRLFVTPMVPELYQGCMHEGTVSTSIGLKGIPALAETIAVAQMIQLADQTGVRLHLSQISCAGSVSLIQQAKEAGLNISADVTLSNLLYTHHEVEGFDSLFHCHPPLRSDSDRQALLEGIKHGTIDAITSAHRPLEEAAKQRPFAETEPGISSLETLLPGAQLLDAKGELDFITFIDAMTRRPRKILGLTVNEIQENEPANLTIYDGSEERLLLPEHFYSRGKNSPWMKQKIKGRVLGTICEGKLTHWPETHPSA